MPKHGKNYTEASKRFDSEATYEASEALELVRAIASAKFDETVEVAFRLNIDPRQAEQLVRGTVALPHGTGKTIRVAVFAEGDEARAAEEAGADIIGGKELAAEIAAGRDLDFDLAIASPGMMADVGKLGKVLGPRGLMPNPKAGTVTPDVGKAVSEFKGGRIEYRNDRYGNVHAPIGRVSFTSEQLTANLASLASEIQRARPASVKGRYLMNLGVSSTMGPGITIDLGKFDELVELAQ